MNLTILTLEIRYEQDVVLTRQTARQIAELLGFESQDQVRLATAISEIARNAFQYAGGGKVEFRLDGEVPQNLIVGIYDSGPGIPNLKTILEGRYTSTTGMGLGIIGTQRLVDQFHIESVPEQGTKVVIYKNLPKKAPNLTNLRLNQIKQEFEKLRSPQSPFEEIQRQNQELLQAMAELRKREEELMHLNRELEDTNRGVVALYAELDEKADSLQKANELKTRFFSNMSHEFRTPLNSMISLSRILLARMDGPLTEEQEKQVMLIQKSANSLLELINDLLDLAKVEAGKITVHPSDFEVSELFGALRGMLRPLLGYNSAVALIFEAAADLPTLHTDEGKVAQILRNFISNALKYTEQGEVRITAVKTGDTITFSVADTGIGIASEDQERIFDDFVQIESKLQKQAKGTGLGLPLSLKLAQLLGGNVSVKSEPGKGSTFFASIPLVYAGLSPQVQLPSAWQVDLNRSPVLVVEDNEQTLLAYEEYLQASNYQVIAARTLNEAKQAMQKLRPYVIILDIILQDQSTWSFLAEIKSNDVTRDIPVLVITVVNNEKQALALGADGFLIKPVDRLLLLEKLDTLVKQKKLQKLLIIDDDQASRYVLRQLLTNTSLDILEAANGSEGLQLAEIEKPQAIVLDLNMPGMDGVEVLKQLKANPITSTISVIINTSKSLDLQEQNYLATSCVAIISKQTSSQAEASVQLRQALVTAGLILNHN